MRFGVRLPHFHRIASDPEQTPANIVAVAQLAEALGFDSIWVGDHVVPPRDSIARFGTVWYEAVTTLTYAAAVTSRVRLGTSVLVAPYRHPLLLGKMLSTLDVLSGGRVNAGFGTGWYESEFRALGLDTFADRGAVTDEYIATMKAVWSGQPVASATPGGEDVLFAPGPLQEGGIPVWIGGNTKRAARRVVELGDAWLMVKPSPEEFTSGIDHFQRLCEVEGRDPASVTLGVSQPLVLTDEPMPDSPFLGNADDVVRQMQPFVDRGVEYFCFDMFYNTPELDGCTIEQMQDRMVRFADEVMPQFESAAIGVRDTPAAPSDRARP